MKKDIDIAFIIPCFNEALSIGSVINEAKKYLPESKIFVFDNRSTDNTAKIAREHGAEVFEVKHRGKGNVVRRMLADIESDVYIMIDGDATYDLSNIKLHVLKLRESKMDMIVGSRVHDVGNKEAYRPGHQWGNKLLTSAVARLFGGEFTDMLSGYRIFSRRYVKSFPVATNGFEIETELTIHALELKMLFDEVAVNYFSRPAGSQSKLSTYKDGWRILKTIIKLIISERPLLFFSIVGAAFAAGSIVLAVPLMVTYFQTGLVPRFPTAVLTTGMMLSSMLTLFCGFILHNVTIGRQEMKRLIYLSIPAPQ